MATPTELYINAELPKRPYTAQYPLTTGHVPVATGVGLEVEARQLDVTDVANAASETYVNDAISALVDGAPAALDTLNELAAAINDDENYASTVTTALGNRLRVDVNNQGLTNTEKQNGLDNLGITEVITDASVNASGLITFTKNTGQASDTVQIPTALNDLTFNSTTGVLTLKHTNGVADSTITVASNEIADDVFRVKDNVDGTKKIAFEASGITAATTRTITMPDRNVDLGQIPATHTSNGNSVTGSYGAIVNGLTNTASGQYSAVINGTLNTASGKHGIVISGQSNTAKTDQVIINGRNITGIETTGAVVRGGIVEGITSTSDALGTTVAEYTLRGRIVNGVTNWILANGSTNAAMSAAVTTASSIKATLSITTSPDIVNACGIHDVTFMIIGSSGSPKPIFAGQRRVMVYYNGTTYTMAPVQTIGTDYIIGGATSTLTIGLTPSAPLGLLIFAVTNNEANNVVANISVKSTYNNYQ